MDIYLLIVGESPPNKVENLHLNHSLCKREFTPYLNESRNLDYFLNEIEFTLPWCITHKTGKIDGHGFFEYTFVMGKCLK